MVPILPLSAFADLFPFRPAGRKPLAIAIGASTGGPDALQDVLFRLPAPLRVPVFVTQHMPPLFTRVLGDLLTKTTGHSVREAVDGEIARAGLVYIAPGDRHMRVEGSRSAPRILVTSDPPENYCRPSIDPMLRSLSKVYGGGLLAVMLTGMGEDGAQGAHAVVQSGGRVMVQDRSSSLVWDMPGSVVSAGLADQILPLTAIGPAIAVRLEAA